MMESTAAPSAGRRARINLKTYSTDMPLGTLAIGVDNIHFDVFLSPRFVEFTRSYLLDLVRQTSKLPHFSGLEWRPSKPPETSTFKKYLTELMQASLGRAKYEKNIDLDLLLRLSLAKFLTHEIGNHFANVVLDGKDDTLYLEQYVLLGNYSRDQDRMETIDALLLDFLREFVLAGDHGEEMSEAWKSHNTQVDAALSTRGELARLEEEREGLLRRMERGEGLLSRVGWHANPATLRAALADAENRHKHLQQKLEELGPRLEAAKQKAEFLTEQYQSRLADYLNQPENARRLFDPNWPGEEAGAGSETRAQLLAEWISRLRQRDLLVHVLASYELRNLYRDYCP